MKVRSIINLFIILILVNLLDEIQMKSVAKYSRILKRSKRVTNGYRAKEGQLPFAVSLQWASKDQNETLKFTHFCGGTLIKFHKKIRIITAAHCMVQSKNKLIFAQLNGSEVAEYGKKNKFFVNEVFMHNFNQWTMDKDIAILKMNETDSELKKYRPLKLRKDVSSNETNCYIYGYGTETTYGKTTKYLNFGKVSMISLEECKKLLGRVTAPQSDSGKYCALGQKVDSCRGDSGSGHLCRQLNSTKFLLRGITSYGMGCQNNPSVYQDVLYFIKWIKTVIKAS